MQHFDCPLSIYLSTSLISTRFALKLILFVLVGENLFKFPNFKIDSLLGISIFFFS